MDEVKCFIPKSLDEALRIRKEFHAKPLAGGSDLMVSYYKGIGIAPVFPFPVMIISNLSDELGTIRKEDDGVHIGALSTPNEIASSMVVPYPVRKAASLMGAPSLRNTATIGGNIGNASPKGDLPQPLILLDAEVVLRSVDGERRMKVDDFILGSKKAALADDEIITGIVIPEVKATHYFYHKIGMRRANAISKLSLSALFDVEDGVVVDFRASSGAAGPKVRRSRDAEEILIGLKLDEVSGKTGEFLSAWNSILSPHAMPEYRRASTRRMLLGFIEEVASGALPGNYD